MKADDQAAEYIIHDQRLYYCKLNNAAELKNTNRGMSKHSDSFLMVQHNHKKGEKLSIISTSSITAWYWIYIVL